MYWQDNMMTMYQIVCAAVSWHCLLESDLEILLNVKCWFCFQVNSGFAFEGDVKIIARQIRDRILQVKRERERKQMETHGTAKDSAPSTPAQVQAQVPLAGAAQTQSAAGHPLVSSLPPVPQSGVTVLQQPNSAAPNPVSSNPPTGGIASSVLQGAVEPNGD